MILTMWKVQREHQTSRRTGPGNHALYFTSTSPQTQNILIVIKNQEGWILPNVEEKYFVSYVCYVLNKIG